MSPREALEASIVVLEDPSETLGVDFGTVAESDAIRISTNGAFAYDVDERARLTLTG